MKVKKTLLGFLALVLTSCNPGGNNSINQVDNSLSASQKAELEALVKDQLEKRDENGNVSELEGFNPSDKISSLETKKTTIADLQNGSADTTNNPIQSDEQIFDFTPPNGIEADFSEPIMIIGSSLLLTNDDGRADIEAICSGLDYFPEEPTMQDILEFSRQENVCGESTFNFCIRLSIPGSSAYTYAQSPNIYFDLPCAGETFAGAKIEIDYGRSETDVSTAVVDIYAKNSVTEVYLTNSPGCMEGGNWQDIVQDDPQWVLNWVNDIAVVYAKFKDIFGGESECFLDTIAYGTGEDKCFAYDPNFLPENILADLTIAGLKGTGGDYPICTSDGQANCVASKAFMGLKGSELAAKIVSGKSAGGIAGSAIIQTYSNCTGADQKDCITTETYKSMDLSEAGTSASVLDSNFVSRLLTASEFEFWDASGNRHTAIGDADITAANIYTNREIFGVTGIVGATPDCSSIGVGGTWILVPGDSDYGTNDFCVMKYEAKCSLADGQTCSASMSTESPSSTAANTPWVDINQQDSITECASLGKGYHLTTNDEWMTIAANLANIGSNWDGGTVGTNEMARGHSDNNPTQACAADASDANAYVQGSCTGSSSGTFNQRRTHTLSNGEVIWDLSGNAVEWMNYFNNKERPSDDGTPDDDWREFTVISGTTTMALSDLIPTTAVKSFWINTWNSSQSIGQYWAGNHVPTGGALARGGIWFDGTSAGVFTADMDYSATTDSIVNGFRCAVAVP